MVWIKDNNYNTVGTTHHSSGFSTINFTQTLNAGSYYLEIFGTPTSSSYGHPYYYSLNYTCPPPVSGFNASINGNTVTFTNTSTNATSYIWNFGNGNSSTANNPVYTYPSVGTYTVTLTASNSCSSRSASLTINLICGTAAYITPQSSTTFCQGNSVILNANTGSGYTYQWKRNGTNVGSSSSYTAIQSGSYIVIVTANGCSATSNAVTVTVNSLPPATITPTGATSICQGGSVTLNATTGSGYSYKWKRDGTDVSIASSYTATESGSYTVIVTSNGCSATSTAMDVTVSDPIVTIQSQNDISCNGLADGNISLNVMGGTPNYNYLWSNGRTVSTISNLPAGNYSVTVTDHAGCSATATSTIQEPLPLTLDVHTSDAACDNANGSATATVTGGILPYLYIWSNGQTTQNAVNLSAGNYSVTVADANNCSLVSNVLVNSVGLLPPKPVVIINGATEFCKGGQVQLTSSYLQGNQWSTGALSQSINATATGNYSVTYTAPNGCTSASNPVFVNVIPAPAQPVIAQNGSMLESSSATDNQWYFEGSIITGAEAQTLTPEQNGNYQVEVTNAQGCASFSEPFAVSFVGLQDVANADDQIYVFPNPFSSQTTITFPNPQWHQFDFQLIDLSGKILRQTVVSENYLILSREELAKGLYFFRLKGERVFVGKVVVE